MRAIHTTEEIRSMDEERVRATYRKASQQLVHLGMADDDVKAALEETRDAAMSELERRGKAHLITASA